MTVQIYSGREKSYLWFFFHTTIATFLWSCDQNSDGGYGLCRSTHLENSKLEKLIRVWLLKAPWKLRLKENKLGKIGKEKGMEKLFCVQSRQPGVLQMFLTKKNAPSSALWLIVLLKVEFSNIWKTAVAHLTVIYLICQLLNLSSKMVFGSRKENNVPTIRLDKKKQRRCW